MTSRDFDLSAAAAAAAAKTSSFFEPTGYQQAYAIWSFVYLKVNLCLWRYFCFLQATYYRSYEYDCPVDLYVIRQRELIVYMWL